jgi:O-antigen/teichoic acid export membrane protein
VAVWIGTGLAFVATLIAARSLGPSQYGAVVLAVSVAAFIFTLLDLTLDEAVVFHGSALLEAGNPGEVRRLIRAALTIDVLNGLFVLSAVLILSEWLSKTLSGSGANPRLLQVAALASFVTTIDGTTGAVLLLARKSALRAWMGAWVSFLRVVAVLFAVMMGASPMAVLVAFLIASALGSASLAFAAWRVAQEQLGSSVSPAREDRRWPMTLTRFGIHTAVTTSILAGRGSLVPVVIGRAAGVEALGLFTVGMLPVSLAGMATSGLRLSLFPEQARLSAKGDWLGLKKSIRGHTWIGLVVGVSAAAIGYVLLPWLIPTLYSSAFTGSVTPARILLVAAVFSLAFSWAKTLAAAVGRPALRTIVSCVDLVVSITLIRLLADRGATGAAIATSLSVIFLAVAWWLVADSIINRMARENPSSASG